MHHAYSGGGAGWCMFSDLTLALRKIRRASQGAISKIMIIDTDVHQVLQQSVQCMKLWSLPCIRQTVAGDQICIPPATACSIKLAGPA